MNTTDNSKFWVTNLVLTTLVNGIVMFTSINRWIDLRIILLRSVWLVPLIIYIATIAACIFGVFWILRDRERFNGLIRSISKKLGPLERNVYFRIISALLAIVVMVLIPVAKIYFQVGEVVKNSTIDPVLISILYYWFLWWVLWIGVGLVKLSSGSGWLLSFAIFTILAGTGYELYARTYELNVYPFSLGWSEASRYYYGSLIFSQKLYGSQLAASILHPSRYLLQSVPFLWDQSNILTHRIWQYLLWVGLLYTAAWSITHTLLKDKFSRFLNFLFTLFIFLFFLKIGVYYHLAPIIFIPLLFYKPENPKFTMIGLILGSIWAGISRVNWIPVPAALLSVLYLLDLDQADRTLWQLIRKPMIWAAVGIVFAFAAQSVYMTLSGNSGSLEALGSSFTSQLLWDRLFPSDSNALGVLPWMLIYATPILYGLYKMLSKQTAIKLNDVLTLLVLVVFFIGGLLVSVKIGGGADLHNMDAFAVFLVFIPLIYFTRTAENSFFNTSIAWAMFILALITPILFTLPGMRKAPVFHEAHNQDSVAIVKDLAEKYAKDGEVLFINERHLITFGEVDVPLVPQYEVVTLMEMVMSGNEAYLSKFNSDISGQSFSGIVSAKLNTTHKTEGQFFEENNLWNSLVSEKILCYYEPLIVREKPEPTTTLETDETRVEFLVPRSVPGDCD